MSMVVVTHWVYPEVADYLAGFCDAMIPDREEGVWPREKVAGLAAGADGLMVCAWPTASTTLSWRTAPG
jgi:hypothetical protein